ncbi:cation:proton antiporter domain-containing protein [Prosthecomicrobium sp. N25]|uniref:cation:proton antiporter domain-containing protein n=1 Tax=Prosthecomicrobium sp. N25 TaxID=3129254 RepID=UPI003076ED40
MLHISTKVVLLLQIVVVVGLPLFMWRFLRLGRLLPLPIVQIFAGVILGPSICGALFPAAFELLFRKEVLAGVDTLANVAVVLFVFLAGCEADRTIIRGAAGMVLRIGLTGIAAPWILGGLTAWIMVTHGFGPETAARLIGPGADPTLYAVAFGLAMSVTALPVLVVILRELGFIEKPIGTIALAIGGLDDMVLWGSIGVLLPFAAGGGYWAALALAIGGGLVTIASMARVVAPLLERMIAQEAPERFLMSLVILSLFASAVITEATGLHAVVGAFICGLLLPEKLRELSEHRFDVPVSLLLLPFFFLSTGLKTTFDFGDPTIWAVVAIAFVVCIGGKVAGITVPSILSGQSPAFSLTLGVLMQCKGLMEIVVVTVLYQRGIVGELTFSALVLVALISTVITAPLARLCVRVFGEAATQTAEARAAEPVPEAEGPEVLVPCLVLEDGEVRALGKSEVVIGRHSGDDVSIKDVRVSRHHARIREAAPGRWEIRNLTADRSEPNPMQVNGVEKERAEIRNGDRITLGGVGFVFRLPRHRAVA